LTLDLPEATHQGVLYEYAVLVTSLPDEIRTIAQHYRDRGDSENNFDELKNQWGGAGLRVYKYLCKRSLHLIGRTKWRSKRQYWTN
jgi:hypothetical protein